MTALIFIGVRKKSKKNKRILKLELKKGFDFSTGIDFILPQKYIKYQLLQLHVTELQTESTEPSKQ